jgi:hypothetical protein
MFSWWRGRVDCSHLFNLIVIKTKPASQTTRSSQGLSQLLLLKLDLIEVYRAFKVVQSEIDLREESIPTIEIMVLISNVVDIITCQL